MAVAASSWKKRAIATAPFQQSPPVSAHPTAVTHPSKQNTTRTTLAASSTFDEQLGTSANSQSASWKSPHAAAACGQPDAVVIENLRHFGTILSKNGTRFLQTVSFPYGTRQSSNNPGEVLKYADPR